MVLLALNWTNVAIVTCFGIGMVLFILFVLVGVLKIFSAISTASAKKAPQAAPTAVAASAPVAQPAASASEAEKAAIAMALHLYFAEVHDTESYRLTIRHNAATAWNSKIFGMNNLNM